MKKIFSLLAAAILCGAAFALPACGDGKANGDGESNRPELPDGATTYLSRAGELIKSVESLPTASDVSSIATEDDTRARRMSIAGTPLSIYTAAEEEDYVDLTDPDENASYQEYLMASRLIYDQYHSQISNSDVYVEVFRAYAKNALENIVQLNTWIYIPADSAQPDVNDGKYRLNYDEVTDTATIEFTNAISADTHFNDLKYCKLTAAFNEEGGAIIKGYSLRHYTDGTEPDNIITVDYEEDKYWKMSYEYQTDDNDMKLYNYITGCDLSGESKKFFMLPYGNLIMIKESAPAYIDLRREDGMMPIYDGNGNVTDTIYLPQYYFTINNTAGDKIGSWNKYISDYESGEDMAVEFDIYETEGWDNFYYLDGKYYLTVDGEIVASDGDPFTEGRYDGYETAENGNYEYDVHVNYSKDRIYMPAIRFQIRNLKNGTTYADALREIMENTGIRVKDDIAWKQLGYMDTTDEVLSQFNALGINGNDIASIGLFEELIENYKVSTISTEELLSIMEEPYLYPEEQTEDYSYYRIFDMQLTGRAAIGADGQIDLSAVTVTLSDSALAVPGDRYAAIAVVTDGFVSAEIARAEGAYSDGNLVLSGFAATGAQLPESLPAPGQFTVKIYAVRLTDDGGMKISELRDVAADGSYSAEADGLLLTVAGGEKLTVTLEEVLTAEGADE